MYVRPVHKVVAGFGNGGDIDVLAVGHDRVFVFRGIYGLPDSDMSHAGAVGLYPQRVGLDIEVAPDGGVTGDRKGQQAGVGVRQGCNTLGVLVSILVSPIVEVVMLGSIGDGLNGHLGAGNDAVGAVMVVDHAVGEGGRCGLGKVMHTRAQVLIEGDAQVFRMVFV